MSKSTVTYTFSSILVLTTIVLGWKYNLLGFLLPIVMISAISISFFAGRHHCGHVCPRGFFLSAFLSRWSRNKKIPEFFKNMKFRIAMLLFMIGFMSFMISLNVTSLMHWGKVFWMMCSWTTVAGIILGLLFRPRTWCSFCPAGTMQKIIGQDTKELTVDSDQCKSCMVCELKCPLNLKIVENKEATQNKDCIKCDICINHCPVNALERNTKKTA